MLNIVRIRFLSGKSFIKYRYKAAAGVGLLMVLLILSPCTNRLKIISRNMKLNDILNICSKLQVP